MTDSPLDLKLPYEEFYDYIPYPKSLVCWGFDIEELTKSNKYQFTSSVYKAMLKGFGELAKSKNKRARERHIPVLCGYIIGNFWIGVPEGVPDAAFNILNRHLTQVTGYKSSEVGAAESFGLSFRFAYDRGRVIQYLDESVAGEKRRNAYGSGVTVNYRLLLDWGVAPG
ncbi:MAG: hypothetical protein LC803_22120 [Acidobacteria bacterium]|nr:hypothetical protein [Acidobacteriota bacterium]